MSARVSPQWAEGLACPHCGRPLTWIGHWRRDPSSPDGWSFVREPFTTYHETRVSPGDRAVTRVVNRSGHEARAVQAYEHRSELQCGRCSKMYSRQQASKVPPLPEGEGPAGYWLDG